MRTEEKAPAPAERPTQSPDLARTGLRIRINLQQNARQWHPRRSVRCAHVRPPRRSVSCAWRTLRHADSRAGGCESPVGL